MCLSNVNVITKLYKNVYEENGAYHFDVPFDTIVAKTTDTEISINNFYLVADFNLLGTTKENHTTNIVNNKGILHILIRMTRLSNDLEKQMNLDLYKFDIDLSDENIIISKACVPYISYEKILKITKIPLSPLAGLGNYVIKTLVRTTENDTWNIQSITPLRIE